jgi:hypothetical protein
VKYNEKGTRLLVHRFDTSTNQVMLLDCNCMAIYGVPHMIQSRSRSQVQRSMALPPHQAYYLNPSVPVSPAPIMAPVPQYDWNQTAVSVQGLTNGFQALSVGQPTYAMAYYAPLPNPAYVQPQYASGPTYVMNSFGLPVNVSNGFIATECREVHIANIPYQTKKRELTTRISGIATPSSVDFHTDHAGKFKGSAIATFESGEAAARVVEQLDKQVVKGKKLRVRIGKQQTPVSPTPVVVNGSTDDRHG